MQYIYNTVMLRVTKRAARPRKTVAMTFRFTEVFRERLVAAAESENRSQANLIETLVNNFCVDRATGPKRRDTSVRGIKAKGIR